jgi:TetR/AcrR family transcriptional regulator, repressor for uid operon
MRTIDPIKQQAKRQQIVDAAIICFAKSGFHATSTAQICAQAGMSPGNLFHYFPTKDAIIQAIAELDRHETALALGRLRDADNVVTGLQDLARDVLLAASDRAYAAISIEIAAEATRNAAVAALFAANDQQTRSALVTELQRGVDQGHVDASLDLPQTASWLIALLEGGVGRAALDPDFNLAANQKTLCDMIARLLVPTA